MLGLVEERRLVAERRSNDRHASYDRARIVTVLLLTLLLALTTLYPLLGHLPSWMATRLTFVLAFTQDVPVAPLFLAAALLRPTFRRDTLPINAAGGRIVLLLTLLFVLVVGWVGHQLVFQGFDLSRDEKMANFDADIFARGRLFWPIPPEWRQFADALNRNFMLAIGDREFWVSAYLPVHAMFRGLVSAVASPALSSPLLAAAGAIPLWAIARRLWPDSPATSVVVLLLYGTSSQIVITSMTAFSMTMHLTLNLVWLALFLKERPSGHVAAIAVAFLATGIHQPFFHPVFAAPILLLLAYRRQWGLLGAYVAAYAVILAFWTAWPHWIASYGSVSPVPISGQSGIGYTERLLAAVGSVNLYSAWLMAANLLRFVCWQHLLLMPLALLGAIAAWRSTPLVAALGAGIVVPVLFFGLILPWQGHGWGYRYLHPVLGNFIILAGFGWRHLERTGWSLRRPFLLATLVSAVLLLPVHAWMASRLAAPFATVRKELASVPADIVIVDTQTVPLGYDFAFNRFDLSNRPKLLMAALLKPEDMPQLCRIGSIAFFEGPRLAPVAQLFGTAVPTQATDELRELRSAAQRPSCSVRE